FGIYKLDASDGHVVGKLDIDEANNATDIELSPDGTTAYVVDLMFNSYHIFNTRKGQGADVTTLFAPPSAFGPGGADSARPCVPDALRPVAPENPFRLAPQAQDGGRCAARGGSNAGRAAPRCRHRGVRAGRAGGGRCGATPPGGRRAAWGHMGGGPPRKNFRGRSSRE